MFCFRSSACFLRHRPYRHLIGNSFGFLLRFESVQRFGVLHGFLRLPRVGVHSLSSAAVTMALGSKPNTLYFRVYDSLLLSQSLRRQGLTAYVLLHSGAAIRHISQSIKLLRCRAWISFIVKIGVVGATMNMPHRIFRLTLTYHLLPLRTLYGM